MPKSHHGPERVENITLDLLGLITVAWAWISHQMELPNERTALSVSYCTPEKLTKQQQLYIKNEGM